MNNLGLDRWLKKLDEETEETGITKTKTGLGSEKDFKQMPAGLKKLWREYENAGGDKYDSVWEFINDVVEFLKKQGYTGRHIASLEKEGNAELDEK